jgi:hypothetical protein
MARAVWRGFKVDGGLQEGDLEGRILDVMHAVEETTMELELVIAGLCRASRNILANNLDRQTSPGVCYCE